MFVQLAKATHTFQLAVLSKCPVGYESIVRDGGGYLPNSEHPSSIEPHCYMTETPKHNKWLSRAPGTIPSKKKWIKAVDGYAPIGFDEVIPCPAGTFANNTGLFYEWQCATCPPGMFCDGNMKPCPSGTTSEPGGKSVSGMDI